jgi:hypothetical protein
MIESSRLVNARISEFMSKAPESSKVMSRLCCVCSGVMKLLEDKLAKLLQVMRSRLTDPSFPKAEQSSDHLNEHPHSHSRFVAHPAYPGLQVGQASLPSPFW